MAPDHSVVFSAEASLQKSKDSWLRGLLLLREDSVHFDGEQAVNMMLSSITGVQKAKGLPIVRIATPSAAFIFRFKAEADREGFIAHLNPRKERAIVACQQQAKMVPPPQVQVAVMQAHPELKELHQRLVVSGNITEIEFWASKHRQVRAAATSIAGQATSKPSVLLSLMRAAPDAATGKTTIRLTKDVERQIFAEMPAAATLHAATVPDQRSHAAFFDSFFKMLQKRVERRRKRAAGTLTANDELLTDFEEELAMMEADQNAQQRVAEGKRARLAAADPTVNVAAGAYDGFASGYGVRSKPDFEPTNAVAGAQDLSLAAELNIHADVMLHNTSMRAASGHVTRDAAGESQCVSVISAEERARSDLTDLRPRQGTKAVELQIRDPHLYFAHAIGTSEASSSTPGSGTMVSTEFDPVAAAEAVLRGAMRGPEVGVAPGGLTEADASSALADITAEAQSEEDTDGPSGHGDPEQALDPGQFRTLRQQALAVNELLRHFWHSLPANTRAKQAKLQRVHRALEDLYRQCKVLQSAAQGADRAYVSWLLRPLLGAIDRASDYYAQAALS